MTDPLVLIAAILAIGCLILFAKLKNANWLAESFGKDTDRLAKRIHELEQELEKATATREFRVVHLGDKDWFLAGVATDIERNFKNVIVVGFLNFDEAWEELQRADPDLLILEKIGYELLPLLEKRKVKYPILVLSSSLTSEVFDLNISFLKKPFDEWEQGVVSTWTKEQLRPELSKYIKPINE